MSDNANQGAYYGALGVSFFALSGIAEYTKNYYEQEAKAVQESFKDANVIAEQAKTAKDAGDLKAYQAFQAELKEKMHEFDGKAHTLLKKLIATDEDVKAEFKADTGLNWDKQMINLKKVGGDLKNLKDYKKLYGAAIKAEKIARYGKGVGLVLLEGGEATTEVYEACKDDPHSPHCIKTAYEQSGAFAVGAVGTAIGDEAGMMTCMLYGKRFAGKKMCMLIIPPTAAIGGMWTGKELGEGIGDAWYEFDKARGHYSIVIPETN